ncbi:Dedicator of cytokinesis protein 9 [Triplophysa tibetana]|uniref:Dedicator of cytokinesis protein 9 n=1 Tax=Triplophysa tibetana TaxID=1572043 RepID=A0A5A9NY07_9TELE|nr:Dedicator of cytokinesis protein 9 [Triplophysa tibetana]
MQGWAGRAARKDAVCDIPQQGRSLGEMEVEGETSAAIGIKPKVIEPLDYENVLVQRKTQILSDVLRDMLQFPIDDFQISTLKRQGRTLYTSLPDGAEKSASSLFVQECLKTYNSDWHVVTYKYEDYSGDFRQLPNKVPRPEKLASHVFEVDEDADKEEDAASLGSQKGGVSKHGWLHKANMNSAISVTMRSFKRRYFHLTQLGDGSYNLNFYKDEKISKEPKGTIFLDSCMGVVQNSKVRRFAFELKMQDKSTYLLAADSEAEMDDWISTLNKILHSSFEIAMQERRNGELHDEDELGKTDTVPGNFQDSFQSARDIETKMRSETRLKLFTLDPDTQRLDLSGIEPDVKQFEEKFGKRVLVNCNDLSFNLQSCVAENEEGPTTNVEPFFVVLSLFDVQNSRKISADFHVDLNNPLVRSMILPPSAQMNGGVDQLHGETLLSELPERALQYPRKGVFSVTCPHPDIFLVARIEKVLQGGITHCAEPYMKNSDSSKVAQKVLKNAKLACSRLGQYRMPFAWAARPVFKDASGALDKSARFSALYRQDGNKLSEEDLFKLLADFRKPEKMSKLPVILGNVDVTIDNVPPDMANCVTPSYIPVRPFENNGQSDGYLMEMEEFVPCIAKCSQPFTTYNNHLYVYPKHLKYDNQKSFAKDQHLHNFFHHFQSSQSVTPRPAEGELVKYLKSLHAMEGHVMIKFLPTILNQLVHVLTSTSNEDVAVNTTRVMVHIVAQCHEEGLEHYLRSYVKYVFKTESYSTNNGKTVHEELAKAMTSILKPSTDFLTSNKLLKLSRNQRFTASFHHGVETLVNMLMPHITHKYKDNLDAARNANHSLAVFIKRCFTFMDRGFVFKQINNYITCFVPGDPKTLYEFKFEFLRVVCNHEHYVPLNLAHAFWKGPYSEVPRTGEMTPASPRQPPKSLLVTLTTAFIKMCSGSSRALLLLTPPRPTSALCATAVSRDSLVSTDSGNSLPEKTSDKNGSLDKTKERFTRRHTLTALPLPPERVDPAPLSRAAKRVTMDFSLLSSPALYDNHTNPITDTIQTQSASALGSSMLRCDKLDREEIKNLLLCFLHVLKSMSEDALFTYWNKATTSELMDFFTLLEVCLHQFRYMGKRFIARSQEGVGFMVPDRKSLTLPVSRNRGSVIHTRLHQLGNLENAHTFNHTYCHGDADACLLEANISTEVCLTVLDTLSVFIMGFKTQLCADLGHNPLMKKVFQVHLCFLQIPQSETALKQVFTSLRTFIYKFPCTFFDGRADMCACLCYEILKCCNSKLSSIRSDAAHLLYFLMKSNFEYSGRKSFVRTHLQVVIAVSQLIADVIGIGGTRFQQSLSIINNCANSDKSIKHTAFPSDVKDLTKRIRTVLMATEQMKEHEKDPEMLVDLQYSLAKSYTSTPELRKTWLDSMAKIHAAMCYVHVAALVAEYLKRKGMFRQGCTAFRVITPNIDEEAAMMEDVGMQDVHFNEEVLMELLEACADGLWKAERYELIADIYKLIIPIYEQRRDFEKLAHLYDTLHRAYTKVMEVMHSGKRLLGTFFRVAFFGQGFFEDEDGKEYIYKEPKFTPLSEISQRLLKLYSDKFGQENVKMIQDSGRVNPKDLEAKFAYIQVTHVTPYLEEKELEERKTDFERSHNIRRFVFETPFTESGKRHGGVEEQCKRRTVLTTTHCFPYVKKRIAVMYQHHTDLSPIEVAIDEMSGKVAELRALCATTEVDMIRLQLKLQGSISVQVNAGPLTYARTFLDDACAKKYPDNKVKQLKEVFRQFVEACGQALAVNERLIKEDQQEYHDEMKASYRDLTRELSHIMHEQPECCGYPISIFFIVVNEFCERFSYYGMRAVLVLYFRYFLRWDDDLATTIYHTFVALCYLTPILGAVIADSWLGKFKTIVSLSVVYCIGQVVMAVSSIHDITDTDRDGTPDNLTLHIALSMVGLLLIALGTGAQECGIHTKQQCYPLAFGVPAALMLVALSKGMYVMDTPKGNVLLQVMKCIGFAIKNRFRKRGNQYPNREHWMDWAEDKYDKLLIAQVKMVLKVMFLYIPLPMFWALFDQQGSRWTLQATTMNGNFGAFNIEPDMMQIVNPVLIVIMVPIMDNLVYPLIKKCHVNFTPLRRITIGMLLAALAFVAAALLQIQIDASGEYLTFDGESFTVSVGGVNSGTASFTKGARQTVLFNAAGLLDTLQDLTKKPEQGVNDIKFVNGFRLPLNISTKSQILGFIAPFKVSNYTSVRQGKTDFTIENAEGGKCTYTMQLGFGSSYTVLIPSTFSIDTNFCENIKTTENIEPNAVHMAWQVIQYFLMTCGEVMFSVTGLDFSYAQAPSNMKSVLQAGWLLTVAVGNIVVLIVAEAGTLSDQWAEYVLFSSLLVAVSIIFSIMAYFYTYIDPAEIEAKFKEHEPEDKEEKDIEMTKSDLVSSEIKQTKI